MILPVNLDPYAKTYQHHALPLSALTAEDKDADIYVMNNFIQVFYHAGSCNFNDIPYFKTWECVDGKSILAGNFENHGQYIQRIKESLNKGRYLYAQVNERYIPNRSSYLNDDFNHNILVHGYEDNVFSVLGYCDDGQYRSTTVPVDNFEKAIYDQEWAVFFKVKKNIKKFLIKIRFLNYLKITWSHKAAIITRKVICFSESMRLSGSARTRYMPNI